MVYTSTTYTVYKSFSRKHITGCLMGEQHTEIMVCHQIHVTITLHCCFPPKLLAPLMTIFPFPKGFLFLF